MSGSNRPVTGTEQRGAISRTIRPWRFAAVVLAVCALPNWTGCSDFHLAASNLDIGPNPAVPGDAVVASFLMNLIPTQNHTIILIIDDEEHLRMTSNETPPIPVIIQLGDAAGLIDRYGPGEHEAYIQVHAGDEVARTQAVVFRLDAATP